MHESAPQRKSLRQRLEWEIIERSNSGTIGFLVFSVLIFFFPFGRHYHATPIRICAITTFVICAVRVPLILKLLRQGSVTGPQFRLVVISKTVNSFSWSLLFGFATWDLMKTGEFSVFAFAAYMAFICGSLVSIPASKFLFRFFQSSMIAVQILVLLIGGFLFRYHFDRSLFVVYISAYLYLLREGNSLRKRMIITHCNQMRMEAKNAQLLRSRQKLVEQTSRNVHASRLASLGEMAGGIAHEINNPLAIIDLSLDAFQMHLEEDPEISREKALHTISRCQSSVTRISTIIRGLRNFSRAGDQDPLLNVAVRQIILEALDLCQEKMKVQEITFQVAGDDSLEILCRPVEIGQILVNLINNSFEIVAELPVGERLIKLDASRDEKNAILRVSDSGPPLSKEIKNKIFQPFFTTKPVGVGTGLGLSISRAIAKRHGGDLSLDAEALQTTFILTIPLANKI